MIFCCIARRQTPTHPLLRSLLHSQAWIVVGACLACAQTASEVPDRLFSQAAELEKVKDYQGAEKIYRRLLLTLPEDPEVLKKLGAVCQAEGKYEESVAVFQKILKRAPLYPGVNSLMGVSYYALNRFDKAAEAAQKELTANPKDRQGRYYLALALTASGRLFEAIQQLETLRADDPQNAAILYQLVVDYKAATQQAGQRLARLYPDSEYTHAMNAEAFADSDRFDEAILEFKQVLQ